MNGIGMQSSPGLSKVDSSARPLIFVVDDDVAVREAVESLLQYEGYDVRVFVCAAEFFNYCEQAVVPHCLLLDYSLPGLNGLEVQERVARERSSMPIIFMTGYGDIPVTVKAMKAGAIEFLTKPLTRESLLNAVNGAIAHSRSLISREAEVRVLKDRYQSLTGRERDVLSLVVTGMSNKIIGDKLNISETTVKSHRGSVMRKMAADSLADLVCMARDFHIVKTITFGMLEEDSTGQETRR
jgi:FixJ family two-component response regulator